MPDRLSWDDADEIAEILHRRFPDSNPETVADLEIARWVREIPTLADEPARGAAAQAQIEAIRDAWRQSAA